MVSRVRIINYYCNFIVFIIRYGFKVANAMACYYVPRFLTLFLFFHIIILPSLGEYFKKGDELCIEIKIDIATATAYAK